jgi:hypothetical protein
LLSFEPIGLEFILISRSEHNSSVLQNQVGETDRLKSASRPLIGGSFAS